MFVPYLATLRVLWGHARPTDVILMSKLSNLTYSFVLPSLYRTLDEANQNFLIELASRLFPRSADALYGDPNRTEGLMDAAPSCRDGQIFMCDGKNG